MNEWNLSCMVQLREPPEEATLRLLGEQVAAGMPDASLLMVSRYESRIGFTVISRAGQAVWIEAMTLGEIVAETLPMHGLSIDRWEAIEVLSPAEVERRLKAAAMPELVNGEMFAAICGVTRQRISDVETQRRSAAAEGKPHPFPTPVVPGWWLRSAAEHYARTRKRKPGPAPRVE